MSRAERETAQRTAETRATEAKAKEKPVEDEDVAPPAENEDRPPVVDEDENKDTPPTDTPPAEDETPKDEDELKGDEDDKDEDPAIAFYRDQNTALLTRLAKVGVADVQDVTPPEDPPPTDTPPEDKALEPDKTDKKETNLLVEVPADTISTLAQDGDWEGITKVFNEQFNSVLEVAVERATRKIVGIVDNRISTRTELDNLWSNFFSTHPALKSLSTLAHREAEALEQKRLRAGEDANPNAILDEVADMLNPLVKQYEAPADKPPRNRRPKAGTNVPTDKKPDKAEAQSRQATLQTRIMNTKPRR